MATATRVTRRSAFSVAILACLLLLTIAPAASAQAPSVPETGPLGDTIKDAGSAVGGAVEDTAGTVGDTVKDTGGTVGGTVDSVEDGTTGTNVGNSVKDTSGSVGNSVKDTGSTAGNAVKDASKDAAGQVDGTIGDVAEATGTEGLLGGKGNKDNTRSNNGPGKNTKKGDPVKSPSLSKEQRQQQAEDRETTSSPLAAAADVAENLSGTTQAASFAPAFTVDEAIRQALEAAKAFAFPILLTLLVVGFMLIQNRVDKKDPKLALAAVDTADELLSFS